MKNEVTVCISKKSIIEVINFDKETSWIRWYHPDFSNNGNINLPKGHNYKLKNRVGDKVTVEIIKPEIKSNSKENTNHFKTANDMEFYDACLDFMDGVREGQKNPLQTVGDRMRLIECLENKGFIITREKSQK